MSPRSSKKSKKTKSSKGAKVGKASDRPLDVYAGLLLAGFLAVVTGCALLAVELAKYDWTAAS